MDTTIKKPDPIRKYISNGASKKSLCYLAIVLLVVLFVFVGLWYYLVRAPKREEIEEQSTERALKQIIKDLTAPEGVAEPVSEQVMKSISAPSKENIETSEDILKNLTAPK